MKESVVDGDCLVTKTRYRGEDSWAYVHGLRSIGMRLWESNKVPPGGDSKDRPSPIPFEWGEGEAN